MAIRSLMTKVSFKRQLSNLARKDHLSSRPRSLVQIEENMYYEKRFAYLLKAKDKLFLPLILLVWTIFHTINHSKDARMNKVSNERTNEVLVKYSIVITRHLHHWREFLARGYSVPFDRKFDAMFNGWVA